MKKIKNILILAGGDSTRFWPFQDKCFMRFLGKPLVFFLIDELKKIGDKIFLVINKETSARQRDFLLEKEKIGFNVVIQTYLKRGMADGILSAKELLKGETLVVNGSDYLQFEKLKGLVKEIRNKKPRILITAYETKDYFPGGYLVLKKKKVIEVIEKPPPDRVPSSYVKMVVDYFSRIEIFYEIAKNLDYVGDDCYEKYLTALIKKEGGIDFWTYRGDWLTLKFPWQLLVMMNYFLKKVSKTSFIVEKGVVISKNAKIVPPVYLGKEVFVGDFSLVRESHIDDGGIIGAYSEVARSYLGKNVSLHQNYVGDSVLASGVLFGAGAKTANFRLDGESVKSFIGKQKINTSLTKLGSMIGNNSRIGVNCVILPGIKIGRDTFIGPGEVVCQDIPDAQFIFQGKKRKNKFFFRK